MHPRQGSAAGNDYSKTRIAVAVLIPGTWGFRPAAFHSPDGHTPIQCFLRRSSKGDPMDAMPASHERYDASNLRHPDLGDIVMTPT